MQIDLRTLVDRSLQALAREAPDSYAVLCRHLDGLDVRIESGNSVFAVSFGVQATVGSPQASAAVYLSVDRATLLDLVDGELTLEAALWDDRLELRGQMRHLERFFDGLMAYVRGGMRCSSFPVLMAEFRTSSLEGAR